MSMTYLHNPRCSKSRQGIELLESKNADFHIREYLKDPLSENELLDLFQKLGRGPEEVVRKKEALYKELDLKGKDLAAKDWAKVLSENPKLLERPILVSGNEAVVGRPPEELLKLL